MSLYALRSAIVDTLSAQLPDRVAVKAHGGRFTLEELKRHAVLGPSVLVCCLGVTGVKTASSGDVEATAVWAAFIVCTDKPQSPRDAGSLELVSALLPVVEKNLWGRDDVDDPKRLRADNLYSSQLDKQAVALWALTWQQELTLGRVDPSTLDDFLRAHVDWDINRDGEADITDEIDLPQE